MKRFIKWLLVSLLAFSSFFVIYFIKKLNVLETKYLLIITIIVTLLCALNIFKLLRKKTRKGSRIFFGIISTLLIIIYSFICRYTSSTIDFAKKITNIKYETVNYSVMVLNSTNYNEILDLTDKNIGFLSSDNNTSEANKKLSKKLKYNKNTYEEIGTLIGSLYEKDIEAIVINDAYIDLLEENNVEFINEYKTVYTYSIKVSTKDDKVKVKELYTEPFVIYISGSDSRSTVSATARSDVNIIAVVNSTTHKVLLVSTPRDYYVQLHGTTGIKDKLTHAGVYGIEMSKSTMEDLLGVNIDYYVKVSFNTVVNLVNTIDGIDIDSDTSFTAHTNKNCKFVEGVQHVDGSCALAYARERYSYNTGDRHRGENQEQVISIIINKMTNPKYLIRYNRILKATENTFETDITYEQITELAKYELTNLSKWSVESISLDGEGAMLPTYSMGYDLPLYVMIPNEETVNNAKNKINEYLSTNN